MEKYLNEDFCSIVKASVVINFLRSKKRLQKLSAKELVIYLVPIQ